MTTTFWMLAGMLVLVALLFLLPPLLRKPRGTRVQRDTLNVQVIRDQLEELRADLASGRLDEAAFAAARHDLERALLDDVETQAAPPAAVRSGRWMAVVLLLVVPALAVVLYQRLGAEPTLERIAAAKAELQSTGGSPHVLETMVAKLAERLQQEPDNVEGWAMLGRSYAVLKRYNDSVDAYRHAAQLAPDNPDILSSYADVLVTASNGAFTDEVGQLLDRALKADPHHLKSLWLRGHWKYRHDDVAGAIEDWQTVADALPPGDENAATIEQQIMLARGQTGQALDQIVPATQQDAVAPSRQARIQVDVAIDPALAAKASPDDTLFIFARAVQGPRMPLAIVRKRVADLPLTVTLDDSQAMSPAMSLSKFSQVSVGARISKSGQAMPSSGDLEGSVSPVTTDGAEVKVTINEEIGAAAQQQAGVAAKKQTGAAGAVAASGGSIQVHVALDPALAGKASPDDTLFVFARAVQGPRMPLAIVRKRVADLPLDLTLDDSQAMSPAMVLSRFGEVTVGARVSKSGQAMPSSGDLQGSVSPVKTDGASVSLSIDQVVP